MLFITIARSKHFHALLPIEAESHQPVHLITAIIACIIACSTSEIIPESNGSVAENI